MNCSKCGNSLKPVFGYPRNRKDDFPQYEDALVIDFHGGYGMFFDDPPARTILCKVCTILFLADNPWAQLFIKQHAGNIP